MNSYEFTKSMNTDAKQTEALFLAGLCSDSWKNPPKFAPKSWRQEHLKKHVESNFTADKMVLAASGLAADGETWSGDGYVPFQKGVGHMR